MSSTNENTVNAMLVNNINYAALSLPVVFNTQPSSYQGSGGWEQLVDEVSGRFYYYNPTSGATSWAAPEPLSPSSPSSPLPGSMANRRHDNGPV